MGVIERKYKKIITDVRTLHYVNDDGIKITVYSSYDVMVNEMISFGIDPLGKTIGELQNEISRICLYDYMGSDYDDDSKPNTSEYLKTDKYIKNSLITHHLKELSYWLYDFDSNKMPKSMKFDFELSLKNIIR